MKPVLLQARKQGQVPSGTKLPEAVGTPWRPLLPAVHPSPSFLLGSCDPRIWHLRVTGPAESLFLPAEPDSKGSFLGSFHYPLDSFAHRSACKCRALPCKCSHIMTLDSELRAPRAVCTGISIFPKPFLGRWGSGQKKAC